jgi:hypothetical protein
MAIKRKRRTQKATRKLDLTNIRNVLKDGLAWTCLGIVQAAEDGGSHFEIDDGTMIVRVELQPSGEEVDAHVTGGAFGWGVWFVPPVGAEVIVAIPDGETDFSPAIVGVLASGSLPDIVAEDSLVIVSPPGGKVRVEAESQVTVEAPEVLVSDGGSTSPLAFKSDVQDIVDYVDDFRNNFFNVHVHAGVSSGGQSTAVPTTVQTTAPDDPDGTNVLKAE